IYEGTSEICRLGIAKTILKRSARGELDLAPPLLETPQSVTPEDQGLTVTALRAQVDALKSLFRFVLGEIRATLDDTELLTPARQQFLGSLADMAMETYLAESTVLRVAKLAGQRTAEGGQIESALARLVFYRASDRMRQETTEVLAALLSGDALTAALDRAAGWYPTPAGLVEDRALVTKTLIVRNGALGGPP
ncbi:MAG: hypothetical protein VYE68_00205, partial [Acidobacteriota bacterium]|nr:hypothetical protein [Acidobacteriota bacterium]